MPVRGVLWRYIPNSEVNIGYSSGAAPCHSNLVYGARLDIESTAAEDHRTSVGSKAGPFVGELDLFATWRPRFPGRGILRPQICKLFHIAAVGIHGVDVRAVDEGNPAVL